jgi:hypothetical protein
MSNCSEKNALGLEGLTNDPRLTGSMRASPWLRKIWPPYPMGAGPLALRIRKREIAQFARPIRWEQIVLGQVTSRSTGS